MVTIGPRNTAALDDVGCMYMDSSRFPEKLLSPKEAAGYLALGTKAVRALITTGELAALRQGRLLFTSTRAIAAYQQRKFSQFTPESRELRKRS